MDLISVMIPSYNYARFIATAVDSVLAQTYANVEAVVCDNCSTDETATVLRERYRGDPRVRVFRNDSNIGLVPNFNRALTHARGAFVAWLSADDWLLPRHLERLHAVFTAEPQLDVVYTRTYASDPFGNVYGVKGDPSLFPADYVDARDELPPMLWAANQICLPGALFRRALFDEVGPMDETIPVAADWELAVRLALAGKRFGYLGEPSACVRVHAKNASGADWSDSGGSVRDLIGVLEKHLDHPQMSRIRGREARIVGFIDWLLARVVDPAQAQALRALAAPVRETLLRRFEDYEPARVREHRVSVIVPMTMRATALTNAVASIAAQTFSNWEILVVEQGVIPVRQLLRAHPAWDRIACVRLPQRRPAGAVRNVGLEMARGEYVAFLDEDNVYGPEHLASLVDTIERTGADVAVAGTNLLVERADVRGIRFDALALAERLFRSADDPDELGAVANALPLNAILHHRRFAERAGRFNDDVAVLEDFDYLMRLQSTARLAFTGAATLAVSARLHFEAQTLGASVSAYLPTLDALYAAREVPASLAALRAQHRRAVAGVLERFDELAATVDGVVQIVRTLAGRTVFPELRQPSIP